MSKILNLDIKNMVSAIIEIIIGLVIWKMVPGWITEGNKSTRDIIKLACNIIGVILVIVGSYSLVMSLIGQIGHL